MILSDIDHTRQFQTDLLLSTAGAQQKYAFHAGYEPPPQKDLVEYEFSQRVFALEGGGILLRFFRDPVVALDAKSGMCELKGWGLRMHNTEVEDLYRLIPRRFLELYSRADAGRLGPDDEPIWSEVLKQVDYAAFSIERAAPHYVEGVVLQRDPRCRVEWHDGSREALNPRVASALAEVKPGESFGCFAKLDREGKAVSIERVALLS